MKIVYLCMVVTFIVLLIFLYVADYSLYSYKTSMMSSGIDFAVSAAIQEIDVASSKEGLAKGFDEDTGKLSIDNIFIKEDAADNAFFTTLEANTGIKRDEIIGNALITVVNPTTTDIQYIIKKDTQREVGTVANPANIEGVINAKMNAWWDAAEPDKQTIYVNGNPHTTSFKKRPYYIVVIKNYQIDGLFKKRTATFVGFKGAKMERK